MEILELKNVSEINWVWNQKSKDDNNYNTEVRAREISPI